MDKQMDRQTHRQTDKIDRPIKDGQMDKQTDRWTDRQADRQSNRLKTHLVAKAEEGDKKADISTTTTKTITRFRDEEQQVCYSLSKKFTNFQKTAKSCDRYDKSLVTGEGLQIEYVIRNFNLYVIQLSQNFAVEC